MSRKKIILDSIFNIIATSIPIIVLQLVILPIVGKIEGTDNYGIIITLISLSTVFSVPFGNVLNNIRLLMHDEYTREHVSGDFNLLLLNSIIINTLLMVISLLFVNGNMNLARFMGIIIISTLNIVREYFLVTFRLSLNYTMILRNNLIQTIGYLVGLLLFLFFHIWELIYISGFSLSIFFIFKYTDMHKEPYKKTKLFSITLKQCMNLYVSTFLKTFLTYADRLVLFPLLGASAVSVYYASSIVGKIMGMAIMPLSGVLLSHLRTSNLVSKKKFMKLIIILLIVSFMLYFIINFFSIPLLKILYPKWYLSSIELVPINTATALLTAIISIIHPILLRFRDIKWQVRINLVNVLSYIVFIYLLFNEYGLQGFCLGILLSNIIKFIFMIYIYLSTEYTEVAG